ncbi:MAG: hypothetical protein JNL32_15730 [Candidatus Kapabacteria bacterium]|nr:hypothetical protein [Candidatus Kapabacteria bacterium]
MSFTEIIRSPFRTGFDRITLIIAIIVFVVTIGLVFRTEPNIFDEGISVTCATRIMDGDIPYRDYWAMYTPGIYYTLAGCMSVLGKTVFAERCADVLVRLGIIYVLICSVSEIPSHGIRRGAAVLIAYFVGGITLFTYAIFPAILFCFISFLFVVQLESFTWSRSSIIAGFCAALAFTYRLDFGLYCMVTLGITGIVLVLARHIPIRKGITFCMAITIGFFVGLIPLFVLASVTGIAPLYEQLFSFTTGDLLSIRHLPLPSPIPIWGNGVSMMSSVKQWLVMGASFYGVVAINGFALLQAVLRIKTRFTSYDIIQLAISLMGLLFIAQALNRCDHAHCIPQILCAIISSALVIGRETNSVKLKRTIGMACSAGMVLVFAAIVPVGIVLAKAVTQTPVWKSHCTLPASNGVKFSTDASDAAQYVRERSSQQEYAMVVNSRHDKIISTNVMLYFLLERRCPIPYHDIHHGIITRADVQREVIDSLNLKNVQWLIMTDIGESTEPNLTAVSSGVHLLDTYIRTAYTQEKCFGGYSVWKRNR